MLTVCTFKWFDPNYRWNDNVIYGAEHVNKLYRGVKRNLDMDHEFVCVTDDAEGLDPAIRVVPIWDDYAEMGGCYRRLKAFSSEMRDVLGPRFVWMDLDAVVLGDLTPLFSRDEPLILWRNGVGNAPYCGSMVMLDAGYGERIWTDFTPEAAKVNQKATGYVGTDQAWIGAIAGDKQPVWTRRDGVLSYRHVPRMRCPLGVARRRYGLDPGTLPDNARVAFFHGPLDPSMPRVQEDYPWVKENWV